MTILRRDIDRDQSTTDAVKYVTRIRSTNRLAQVEHRPTLWKRLYKYNEQRKRDQAEILNT